MLNKRIQALTRFILRWTCRLSLVGIALFIIAWFALPFPAEEYRRYDASRCITDRNGEILRTTLNSTGQRCLPIKLEDAGEWLPNALVATEDKRFHEHAGVDFIAIARAIGQLAWHREVVSGASTISTQLIRLVKPRPRNLLSKGVEAFRALQMETVFTKEEILEQYINRTPFGGNLVGIRAASLHYFSREPADLSLKEASLLAGVPQSPSRLRPDRHPADAIIRRNHVIKRMAECSFIDRRQQLTTIRTPIILEPWTPPFYAPHFVDAVLQGILPASPGTSSGTTLDLRLQQLSEDILKQHPSRKASGAAIIIVDVQSGDILAMVGSPDFTDARNAGQVNAALASRSPGSTLKPFAYALAFDRGLLTPGESLPDMPLNGPHYLPENYDGVFRKNIPARQALLQSLNLPAIEVLRRVRQESFLELLQHLELKTLNETRAHYGLNLILGGGEVRLLDLARAYAKLAHPGTNDFISPEARFIVAEILSGEERDLTVFGQARNERFPRVAWKTGTSARNRDAWTIAWNPQYVVGVWRGNPDGSSCPGLNGIQDAAPLALEIFNRLYPQGDAPWFERPVGLLRRRICADSGLPANTGCRNTVTDDFIPGISRTATCNKQCLSQLATHATGDSTPRIIRPLDGQTLARVNPGQPARMALQAEASSNIFWFVNGTFLARSGDGRPLTLNLGRGTHEITCTTLSGKSDRARIVVE